MRPVIRYFVTHPTIANLLMLAIVAAGLMALPKMQRETFPRIAPRNVEVTVAWPGARPEDVEQAICQRVEDAVHNVDNVHEITCVAMENVARTTVEMVEGASFEKFTSDIKTEVEAIDDFPDLVEKPVIRQLGTRDFVTSVALSAPAASPVDLKMLAEDIKDRMERTGKIPKVTVRGFSTHQIRIALDSGRLRAYGLSVQDVANAVMRSSFDLPTGSLQTRERDILIRYADEGKRPRDYENIVVVASSTGGEVRLGDIAKITDRFELDEEKYLFNGRRAAILDVTKTPQDDVLRVVDAVKAFIKEEKARLPEGVVLEITNDQASQVRDRLDLILTNSVQGLILVFATLWLFFGLRYSFWVAMGLPISFLGGGLLMVWGGMTINMMTMIGLLIVIGLLMDDAIVISENIAAHRAKGKAPVRAAIDGVTQVLPSVFASFITTAVIFGSLAFLKGDLGQILRVIPIVMLFVLAVSLVEAFLILPHHLLHTMEKMKTAKMGGRFQDWMNAKLESFSRKAVEPVARFAVNWRYFTFGFAAMLFLLAVAAMAGGKVKFEAFPDLDGNTIAARILLPAGSPLELTERTVAGAIAALREINREEKPRQPEQQDLVRNITVEYNRNDTAGESGPHVATITADLLDAEIRTIRIEEVLAKWREKTKDLPDVVWIRFSETKIGPAGLDIEMRLQGDDLEEMKAASNELMAWLKGYVGAVDISDDLRPGKPEFRIRLKPGARMLGLDGRLVADQLRAAFHYMTVNTVQRDGDSIDIDVQLSDRDRDSVGDLDNFDIALPDGRLIPLKAVAEVKADRGYSRITRINGQRAITITGDVDTRIANANEIVTNAMSSFVPKLLEKYPGVRVSLEGADRKARKTQKSILSGFVIGIIGIYLLLSFQFRSYIEPVVVMSIIPFAFVGAIMGHLIMGLNFSMPSLLGLVALSGVVVNNSILLVNFIKHYHGETASVKEAAPLASRARFRAIVLTSMTTFVGLLPILTERSLQAQILTPLVSSLAFGLLAATFLVLLVVPSIYAILDDFGLARLDEPEEEGAEEAPEFPESPQKA